MSNTPDGVEDLGYATVDLDREARQGLPEVILGPGKTPQQITGIARALVAHGTGPVLVTRVEPDVATVVSEAVPGGVYDADSRLMSWRGRPAVKTALRVAVVSAGTSDGPVACEAAAVCSVLGFDVVRVDDVGVAGLHRLMRRLDDIDAADLVIVVAGMEGALASVVGGLVGAPVIAVPTSTGYGSSFEGATALLAMTASCAAGVVVVGVDNGFGAAMAAHRLGRIVGRTEPKV